MEHGDLEVGTLRGTGAGRAILAGPEKARNEANFAEVQSYLEVARVASPAADGNGEGEPGRPWSRGLQGRIYFEVL